MASGPNSYVTEAPTLPRVLHRAFQVFAHAPCLGSPRIKPSPEGAEERKRGSDTAELEGTASSAPEPSLIHEAVTDVTSQFGSGEPNIEYKWKSFAEVGRESQFLAAALLTLLPPRGVVGICGPNRSEWVITDVACCFADLVTVGLHTSWPEDELISILRGAEVTAVVCDKSLLPTFARIAEASGLKHLVCMDNSAGEVIAPSDVGLHALPALIRQQEVAAGPEGDPPRPFLAVSEENGDEMFTLIYASGTSGVPKAIMTPKARWKRDASAGIWRLEQKVIASYSALAHGMDRGLVWQNLLLGGRTGFVHPDWFFPSIRAIGPSLFFAMPHHWNDLFADFNSRLRDALAAVCM